MAEAFRTVLAARFPKWDAVTILLYVLSLVFVILVCLYRKTDKPKILGTAMLFSYVYSVLVTTLFMRSVYPVYRYTLKITFIRQILLYHNYFALAESVLNFVMLIPVGLLMPLLIKSRPFSKTVLFGFSLTLFIELTQLVTRLGEFQTDDLVLNFTGCLLGAVLTSFFEKIAKYALNRKANSDYS